MIHLDDQTAARSNRRRHTALAIWVLAFAAFVAFTNAGFFPRLTLLAGQERWGTLVGYLGVWGLSLLALLIAAAQKNVLVRLGWAVVISVTTAVGFSFRQTSGGDLAVLDAVSLWSARHEAARAMDFYAAAFVSGLAIAACGLALFVLQPMRPAGRIGRWLGRMALLPALPVLVIAAIIHVKEGGGSQALPTQFAPLSVSLVSGAALASHPTPARREVSWTAGTASARRIIVLVDESVRGDYIDWRPGNPYTPALAALKARIVDFGPAASGGVCSHYSNALLRFPTSRDKLGTALLTTPTIWQYAKRAGFRTVFLDAQAAFNKNAGKLQNFMTVEETRSIDSFHAVPEGTRPHLLDDRLLDAIVAELRDEAPVFIYATKNGAHFPYDMGYPESETRFRPTMREAGSRDTAARVNSYRNVLRWSVDRFFARLFAEADLRDTVIIYTSDHGQTFNPDRFTHCSVEQPDPREALVPLFAITGDARLSARFSAAAAVSRGHASHFSIGPTVLKLLGYRSEDVDAEYAPSLLDPNSRSPMFTSGDIFGLFSANVRWHAIDLRANHLETEAAERPQSMSMSTEGAPR